MPSTTIISATPGVAFPHRSPMKEVVSKMKKGVRRVRRFASFSSSRIPGRHDNLSVPAEPNIVAPFLPTTTIPEKSYDKPCDARETSFSDEDSLDRHYSSSSSSSSAMSTEMLPEEKVTAVQDPSPSPPPLVEPEVPNPFLIEDEDSDSAPEEELPSPPSPIINVNKDVPPPPPQLDNSDEEDAPDLYLPGLVLPTMFLPIPNTDPLTTLLTKYIYPPDKRPFRDSSGEWQNSNFHTLVMTNSWRALARMARDRLVTTNPEDLTLILGLWYLRLSCLARLRLFNQTSAECTNLFSVLSGITPPSAREWVYERVLPFELEVMQVRLNYWAGDYMAYIDALSALLAKCRVRSRQCVAEETSRSMWKERGARIALILSSQFMEMKDFGAATKLLEPLCNQQGTAASAVRSTVARVYLQAGQIRRAEKHFAIVAEDDAVDQSVKDMNAALLASAYGRWEEATEVFRRMLDADAENYVAVNNLAVALLGQGKLTEGIAVLEKALTTSPSSVVVAEPFLFNLSTLYELHSATATDKKRDLLIQVAQWSGDGLRTTCLKMPTN